MASTKNGLTHLIRQVGQEIRAQAKGPGQDGAKIFSVLDYIEQPWGLNMRLYPAQRFLVKLYYNLELDKSIPEDPNLRIQVTDMFKSKILYELSEYDYLRYLHNEGRCNIGEQDHDRRELVLAIGRRAGKCVEGDTLVLTDEGIFRIEDLGIAPEEGFVPAQITVAQEKKKLATSVAFYNGGVKSTLKVRFHTGRTLTGTPNHRIKVMTREGVIDWRYLSDLKPGDRVAIHRGTDLWAPEILDVRPYHTGGSDVALPDLLDETLGKLLGYLVGGVTWNPKYTPSLTVEQPYVWRQLKTLLSEVFKGEAEVDHPGFSSVRALSFLAAIGWKANCSNEDKRVPWSILRSPKKVVCAFIRGLFETDLVTNKAITYRCPNYRLAEEIQTVLLNMGILSKIDPKGMVSVQDILSRRKFMELIGFDSEAKNGAHREALDYYAEGRNYSETIPHQYDHVMAWLDSIPKHTLKPELGAYKTRLRAALAGACKAGQGEELSYLALSRSLAIVHELGMDLPETKHFEDLMEAYYFYDKVVEVSPGETQVYDLTVPDGEMFVANGIINHNTTLSGIFASYEVYRLLNLGNPQEYFGLPNGNRIQIISVATDKEQAGLLFNEVTSHLAKCDYFKPFVANNTLSHVNFRTPYDISKYGPTARQENGKFVSFNGKATLRVTFKSCIAKGLRGAGNIVIILDEVAHFQDKGSSSAEEIYQAIVPSSAAFSRKNPNTGRTAIDPVTGEEAPVESRIIMISSPLGRSGKFHEKFDLAMRGGEGSNNILAIQAPTWEINPTVAGSYYREKYHENPIVFMTEHGAQFSDQARGWIERESDLQECISALARPKIMAPPRLPHYMGIDVGLVGDGTAVVISHPEENNIVLDYHEIWYAGKSWMESNPHLEGRFSTDYARSLENVERLDFEEIANWIALLCRKFHIASGIFDRWHGIALEQALTKRGLRQFTSEFFTRDQSSKIYQVVKMLMYNKQLALYDFPIPERSSNGAKHSPLISELLALQATQVSKNIVLVEAPKKVGAHDDLSDAFARSVWLSSEATNNVKVVAKGSPYSPQVVSSMTPQRYQLSRAMRHGFGDRVVPRRLR